MANITLPSNPVNGQTVVIGTRLFQYDSTANRWKSRVFQVLGDTSVTVTNEAPTITASLSEIALDTSGANVSFTYTVSDVDSSALKVSHSVSGIANSDLATVTHHRANNTVTITAGTEAFEGGQITLTVTDGRNNATDTVDVSANYGFDWTATTQQAKLVASDAEANDRFSELALAISGDTVVVSAHDEDTGGTNAGAAYVFTRSGSTWTEQAKLVASDASTEDEFGYSADIDGDTIIVGKPNDDNGGTDAGAAYIFTRSGSTWTQQSKIVASDIQVGDRFGISTAISGDTVVVGSYLEDTGGSNAGAVYIFTRSGSTWTQQAKIQASDPEANDRFGGSVGIDGDTVIVGVNLEDTGGTDAGAAYIFTRSGSTWTQQQKIQSSDIEAGDNFAISVAISGDTVAVGAQYEQGDSSVVALGAAYIFTRSGSTWTQQAKIQASDGELYDHFGSSIDIDGDNVIVGAQYEDTGGNATGQAYIFTRDGSTWSEQVKIQSSDIEATDLFSAQVAIEGDTVVVGAPQEDPGGVSIAGAAYIFVAG